MIAKQGVALPFRAFFVATKAGKTGLTVTVDVYKPDATKVVNGGSATEIGGGLYSYSLSSGSNDQDGDYVAIFKTADATVDQQHLPSLWVVASWVASVDAAISTRLATSGYTAPNLTNLDAAVSTRATPAQVATAVAAVAGGGGSVEYTDSVTDGTNPLDGVAITIRTSDDAGLTPVATATTDAFGEYTVSLDPGTYYVWAQRGGTNFANPSTIVVTP